MTKTLKFSDDNVNFKCLLMRLICERGGPGRGSRLKGDNHYLKQFYIHVFAGGGSRYNSFGVMKSNSCINVDVELLFEVRVGFY